MELGKTPGTLTAETQFLLVRERGFEQIRFRFPFLVINFEESIQHCGQFSPFPPFCLINRAIGLGCPCVRYVVLFLFDKRRASRIPLLVEGNKGNARW